MKLKLHSIFSLFFLLFFVNQNSNAQKLAAIPYATGISSPIDIKNCGDDRLFVADKGGFIRVVNADGTLRPTPFLDISSKVYLGTGEDGLFGIVFSPNYKTDNKFYVYYSAFISGHIMVVLEEYKTNMADSNLADISSPITILTQLSYSNDDLGGNLMFGKDGYLYINLGDGGIPANGQTPNTFLGKILRIDVSNSSTANPYAIPSSNPFINDTTGLKKEIWAYGVRNPFRNSVDRLTGDLWIADVGASTEEEINYQPASSVGGANYGWSIIEGNVCYDSSTGCNTTGLTMPIYTYPHPYGYAIIGGYVARSAQSKLLFGTYIFGDYGKKWIDGITQSGGAMSGSVQHFITSSQGTGNIISFGEDRFGDQYIVFDNNTTLYKLEDTSSLRHPKAYFTPVEEGGGTSYLLTGLQGKNLTYQWQKNNVAISGATMPDFDVNSNGVYNLVVTNSLGFSDTSNAFPFGSLPLNLVSFAAQKITVNKIGLQWKTASEQNIEGFTILRKQGNEINYSKIGSVESKSVNGFSSNELAYTFIDFNAEVHSKLFYRLQIKNKDGQFTYSDIRTIFADAGKISFSFYPNPAKDILHIELNGYAATVTATLYNNSGQKVKELLINEQSSTINIAGLKGFYIVQLKGLNGENLARQKLLIE